MPSSDSNKALRIWRRRLRLPTYLEEGLFEATAVLALPEKYCRRLGTSNMLERLIQKVRRREKVICIFPNVLVQPGTLSGLCSLKNMKSGQLDGAP
jgi:hypothetical protein